MQQILELSYLFWFIVVFLCIYAFILRVLYVLNGNRTHDPGISNVMPYHLTYRKHNNVNTNQVIFYFLFFSSLPSYSFFLRLSIHVYPTSSEYFNSCKYTTRQPWALLNKESAARVLFLLEEILGFFYLAIDLFVCLTKSFVRWAEGY